VEQGGWFTLSLHLLQFQPETCNAFWVSSRDGKTKGGDIWSFTIDLV